MITLSCKSLGEKREIFMTFDEILLFSTCLRGIFLDGFSFQKEVIYLK